MKLAEMESLPERAGLARLNFVSKAGDRVLKDQFGRSVLAFRRDDTIFLINNPQAELFWLKNGNQFLFVGPNFIWELGRSQIWFGGTDEQPFLVNLEPEAYQAFLDHGEAGFYQALKPKIIKAIEEEFGVSSKRQGDIFAVPIGFSWQELSRLSLLVSEEKLQPQPVSLMSLFGTRHRFSGQISYLEHLASLSHKLDERDTYLGQGLKVVDTYLAEGLVEAPDHSPLELKGVHLLSQTAYLADREHAD